MAEKVVQPQKGVPTKTYVPIGNLVAVHAYPADKTKAGLYLPDGAENPMQTGIAVVVATGPDCKYVKEGDEILYVNRMQAIIHRDQVTGIINENHIQGIVIPAESK